MTMLVTACLAALVGVSLAVPPWASRGQAEAELSPEVLLAKMKLVLGLESHIREKTEQMIEEKGPELEDIHKDFILYHSFRKQLEVADAVKDKKDLLKQAFQQFISKVKQVKGEKEEGSWGAKDEDDEQTGLGGIDKEEVEEKVKLLFMWKLFIEFETAWLQQNNIVALGLDEKVTRALFFETFGRFVKNAMGLKEKAEEISKFHDFVQQSQQKAKLEGFQDKFKQFLERWGEQSDK